MTVDEVQLAELRKLRLYHWRNALRDRLHAEEHPDKLWQHAYNSSANLHIGFVQILNDFFEAGDTAEKDDCHERQI